MDVKTDPRNPKLDKVCLNRVNEYILTFLYGILFTVSENINKHGLVLWAAKAFILKLKGGFGVCSGYFGFVGCFGGCGGGCCLIDRFIRFTRSGDRLTDIQTGGRTFPFLELLLQLKSLLNTANLK